MEKLCKVLEMELLTYTPVGLKFVFEKIEFEVLHYIQYDFVRQRPGLSMIRLACSNVLLFIQCLWQSHNTYFSSSDWSTLKFLFNDVTNVL